MSTALASAVARGATGSTGLSGRQASSTTWTRSMSPASAPWTPFGPMGYPDDPAIVDNPYQVGLFLGAPRPRGNQQRTLFPPTAPGVPAVVFGVPASSKSFTSHYPFSSKVRGWQQVIARSTADAGTRAEGDRRDGDDGSSHSRTEEASGREYPTEPQVVHREGPRESAGYAYRGIIVGEVSNPGPVDPAAAHRGSEQSADRCRASAGAEGPRAGLVDAGGASLAGPMGKSGCPCRGGLPTVRAAGLPPACGGEMAPLGGAPP